MSKPEHRYFSKSLRWSKGLKQQTIGESKSGGSLSRNYRIPSVEIGALLAVAIIGR